MLNFGLAKALDPSPDADPPQSPTLTAAATEIGVIMGTAAYMSPEQARGKTVDKRADIWAFGAVFYEMLTGRRAFEGEDVSSTLADVIRADLAWDLLPTDLPQWLATNLRRCLERTRLVTFETSATCAWRWLARPTCQLHCRLSRASRWQPRRRSGSGSDPCRRDHAMVAWLVGTHFAVILPNTSAAGHCLSLVVFARASRP